MMPEAGCCAELYFRGKKENFRLQMLGCWRVVNKHTCEVICDVKLLHMFKFTTLYITFLDTNNLFTISKSLTVDSIEAVNSPSFTRVGGILIKE